MGHTRPDWSTYGKLETVFALFDLGEMVARLGSIDTFERGGNVIFLDDLEDGYTKWTLSASGANSTIGYTAETARSGGFCLHLITGDALGRYAKITRYLAYPVVGKMGFEVSFAIPATASAFYLTMDLHDGVNVKRATLLYKPSTNGLYYRDALGSYQEIATDLVLYQNKRAFHTLKMVADLESGKYWRAILNDRSFNLSAYSMGVDASTSYSHLLAEVHAYSESAAIAGVYLDDLIITQNED